MRIISAREEAERSEHGNRALARSFPIAIGHLGEGREPQLVRDVWSAVTLTQHQREVIQAAQLLALGLRNAILTGEPDFKNQVKHLPDTTPEQNDAWTARVAEAEKSTPEAYTKTNNTAVGALQAAIAANAGATDVKTVLERSVRAGGECDRVACIAGAISGARSGSEPSEWREGVWGEPLPMPGQASVILEAYVDRAIKKQLQ